MRISRIERVRDKNEFNRKPMWLTGFTDLVTLLLAFFILLFIISQPRPEPWERMGQSFRDSFGGERDIKATGEHGASASETLVSSDEEPGLDVKYLYSVLKRNLAQNPKLSMVTLSYTVDGVLLSLPGDSTFLPGDTELSGKGQEVLAALVPILTRLSNKLESIGHTDPTLVNNEKQFSSNWHLSLARAYSVSEALHSYGYGARIEVKGRGATDLDNLPKNLPTPARNALARRVDLRLQPMESQ